MSDYPDTPVLEFRLLLTELGVEAEMADIPLEKLKQAMVAGDWYDPDTVAIYEKAQEAIQKLYSELRGHQ